MIAGLKPYPAMKSSGAESLGDIPEHWGITDLRHLLRRVTERDRPDLPLLSVVRERGVILRDLEDREENHNYVPDDLSNYKVVRAGQFAMNKMKAWQGSYGVSQFDGLVSPAYFVFSLDGVAKDFFHASIRSRGYIPFFAQASDGVRIGQWDLSQERMKGIPFAVPPLHEQAAIVRYLDHANRRINRYIRAKQRLIALLEEEKQAIIHQAVTRGLDPDVPLKASGVDWLGNVPEHWGVTRVKHEFDCLNSRRIPLSAEQRGEMSTRRYDYYGASGVIDKVDDFIFDEDVLLIAEDGANLVLRNLPLVITAKGRFWVNNHAHILRPKHGNLAYLASLLEGIDFRPWVSGAAQPKLTMDRLLSVHLAVPPPREQASIIHAVSDSTSGLRSALGRARREVELLHEFRTRLIADVVTGQLDVREAAARLPDIGPGALEDAIELAASDDQVPDLEEVLA